MLQVQVLAASEHIPMRILESRWYWDVHHATELPRRELHRLVTRIVHPFGIRGGITMPCSVNQPEALEFRHTHLWKDPWLL